MKLEKTYDEEQKASNGQEESEKRIKDKISYILDLLEASRKDARNPDYLYNVIINLGQTAELVSQERAFIRNFDISKPFYKLSEAAETFGFKGPRNTTRLNNLLKHPEIDFNLYLEPDRVGKTGFYYHLSHKTMVRFYLIFFLSENYTHAEIAEWQGLIAPTATLLPSAKDLKGFDELPSDKRFTQMLIDLLSKSFNYTNELHLAINKDNSMIKALIDQAKEISGVQVALIQQQIDEKKTIIKRIEEEINRIKTVNLHRIEEYNNLIGSEIKILEESITKPIEIPAAPVVKEQPKKKGFFARLFGDTEETVVAAINPEEIRYHVKQLKIEDDLKRVRTLQELHISIEKEKDTLIKEIANLNKEKGVHQLELEKLEVECAAAKEKQEKQEGHLKYTPASETIRTNYISVQSLYEKLLEEVAEINNSSSEGSRRNLDYNKKGPFDLETD